MTWQCTLCHTADFPRSKRKKALCELCYDGLGARGLAWCSKGGHRVAAKDMASNGSRCRACDTQDAIARYAATHERKYRPHLRVGSPEWRARRQAYRRAWRASHVHEERAQRREWMRRWRMANPDAARESWRRAKLQRKIRILRSWKGMA